MNSQPSLKDAAAVLSTDHSKHVVYTSGLVAMPQSAGKVARTQCVGDPAKHFFTGGKPVWTRISSPNDTGGLIEFVPANTTLRQEKKTIIERPGRAQQTQSRIQKKRARSRYMASVCALCEQEFLCDSFGHNIARSAVRQLRETWYKYNPKGFNAQRLSEGVHSMSSSAGKFKYSRAYDSVVVCTFCRQFFPVEEYLESFPWQSLMETEGNFDSDEQLSRQQRRIDFALSNSRFYEKQSENMQVEDSLEAEVAEVDNMHHTIYESESWDSGATASTNALEQIHAENHDDTAQMKSIEPTTTNTAVHADFDFSLLFEQDTAGSKKNDSSNPTSRSRTEKRTQKQQKTEAVRLQALNLLSDEVQHVLQRMAKLEAHFRRSCQQHQHESDTSINTITTLSKTTPEYVNVEKIYTIAPKEEKEEDKKNNADSRVVTVTPNKPGKQETGRNRCESGRGRSTRATPHRHRHRRITGREETNSHGTLSHNKQEQHDQDQGSVSWRGVKCAVKDIQLHVHQMCISQARRCEDRSKRPHKNNNATSRSHRRVIHGNARKRATPRGDIIPSLSALSDKDNGEIRQPHVPSSSATSTRRTRKGYASSKHSRNRKLRVADERPNA